MRVLARSAGSRGLTELLLFHATFSAQALGCSDESFARNRHCFVMTRQRLAHRERPRASGQAATRALAVAVVMLFAAGCGPQSPPAAPRPAAKPNAQTAPTAPSQPVGPATVPSPPPADPAPARSGPVRGGQALTLLGTTIEPGTTTRITWSASKIFEGMNSETPVLVVNGTTPGPVLCITAAVHGDELNGIEMVRRVFQDLSPGELSGTAIGIPIVNIQGFRRGSRYLPDRRDLNRFFPGNPQGSSAARIAHSLFENIVRSCSALVDLHTGSYFRTNLPQVRADLGQPSVARLAHGFGGMLVLNNVAAPGTLRRAATDAGIPAVILEAGEPLRLQPKQVDQGVAGLRRLLRFLGMTRKATLLRQPEPVYYRSRWVRSDHGGVLFAVVRLGQTVKPGDILGNVTDPITNEQNLILAPVDGRVIGMALNQVVMPGFAAFHLGTESKPGPAPTDEVGKDRDIEALDRATPESPRDSE
jgi:predicted deacylase